MKDQRKYKIGETEVVMLGSLDLFVRFRFPGNETVYRTITYAPYNSSQQAGDRWCMNMTTNKAEWFRCDKKVIQIS